MAFAAEREVGSVEEQFVDAIKEDDLSSLLSLAHAHGTEVVCSTDHEVEDRFGDSWQNKVSGTPLFIAAYLKREELAIAMVRCGAVHRSGSIETTTESGWDLVGRTPIEMAARNQLRRLARALLEASEPIDWSVKATLDSDLWSEAQETPTLLYGVAMNPELCGFLQMVGYFRGLVRGQLVVINKGMGGFDVKVEEKPGRRFPNMREALLSVYNRLEVNERQQFEYQ